MPQTQHITLGHSPDADDAFMFFGLATGAIDTAPFEIEHILRDIQTLNDWAANAKLDVTAISVHAYPYVHQNYAILSSGASMGATELAQYESDDDQQPTTDEQPAAAPAPTGVHGPLLLAHREISLADVTQTKIAIPGTRTTAFLTLQLALGQIDYQVMPFDKILPALEHRDIDAGVIIHEGQLTYAPDHLHCLLDLGKWWFQQTQLPLPLGCNVIRKDLGPEKTQRLSDILKDSIRYSLENRPAALEYARQFAPDLDSQTADRFVGLYVNQWTIDYGPAGRRALTELLTRAHQNKLIPHLPELHFV